MVRSLLSWSSRASSKGPKSTCPRRSPISRDSSPAASSRFSMRVLISARSSTASSRVPTNSSSGTSSSESVSFSSSPTFASSPLISSCSFPRSSITEGLYTIPATSSAPRSPAPPLTTVDPGGAAEEEGERRDREQRGHEGQDGPYHNAVPGQHQQEGGHAGARHHERDAPKQDEQQCLGVHAVHATLTLLPGLWL